MIASAELGADPEPDTLLFDVCDITPVLRSGQFQIRISDPCSETPLSRLNRYRISDDNSSGRSRILFLSRQPSFRTSGLVGICGIR